MVVIDKLLENKCTGSQSEKDNSTRKQNTAGTELGLFNIFWGVFLDSIICAVIFCRYVKNVNQSQHVAAV